VLTRHDPKVIRERLKVVDRRLAESDKEPFGKKRGRLAMRRQLAPRLGDSMGKKKVAKELFRLVFKRHALQHGAVNLEELEREGAIGKSFFGEDAKVEINYTDCKEILGNLYKYGYSNRLERFRKVNISRKNQRPRRKLRHEIEENEASEDNS